MLKTDKEKLFRKLFPNEAGRCDCCKDAGGRCTEYKMSPETALSNEGVEYHKCLNWELI